MAASVWIMPVTVSVEFEELSPAVTCRLRADTIPERHA